MLILKFLVGPDTLNSTSSSNESVASLTSRELNNHNKYNNDGIPQKNKRSKFVFCRVILECGVSFREGGVSELQSDFLVYNGIFGVICAVKIEKELRAWTMRL